jgi:hypothetical protein
MRYSDIMSREPVSEEWIGVTITGGDVYKNPSRMELFKLIQASEYQEVRAFLCANLYVWNTDVLHHDFDVGLLAPEDASCATMKGTPGRQCINLHISKTGPYVAAGNIEFEDDDVTPKEGWNQQKAFVENHPMLRRLFGKIDLKIEY